MRNYITQLVYNLIQIVESSVSFLIILLTTEVPNLNWSMNWLVYRSVQEVKRKIQIDDERKKESVARRLILEEEAERLKKAAFNGKDL
jgi:hypothetical protein